MKTAKYFLLLLCLTLSTLYLAGLEHVFYARFKLISFQTNKRLFFLITIGAKQSSNVVYYISKHVMLGLKSLLQLNLVPISIKKCKIWFFFPEMPPRIPPVIPPEAFVGIPSGTPNKTPPRHSSGMYWFLQKFLLKLNCEFLRKFYQGFIQGFPFGCFQNFSSLFCWDSQKLLHTFHHILFRNFSVNFSRKPNRDFLDMPKEFLQWLF